MLRGIPPILSPELLKTLCEMGHGEAIVLADGNFPVYTTASRVIRMDGHGIVPLLNAILPLFPLDYARTPVTMMQTPDSYTGDPPCIWDEYRQALHAHEPTAGIAMARRFDFYAEAQKAYAVVATGESARFANIILYKGVVLQP